MTRIDLPDGGWAELRDPKVVSEGRRRPVRTAVLALRAHMPAEGGDWTAEGLAAADELNDLGVVALVEAWSFPGPVSVTELGELPGDVYDLLREAVGPLVMAMFPEADPAATKKPTRKGPPA